MLVLRMNVLKGCTLKCGIGDVVHYTSLEPIMFMYVKDTLE